jgi:tRNA A37 threonylcarbamoyladenosine biosynthesis protein TsaE
MKAYKVTRNNKQDTCPPFARGEADGRRANKLQISSTKLQINSKLQISKIKLLIHIDAYRLESFDQLKEIGVEEYLNNKECLVVVEWADKVKDLNSYSNYLEIKFSEGKEQNERIIEILGNRP